MPSRTLLHTLLSTLTCAISGAAQATVHLPSAQHATPPAVAFPFYTPGAGSAGATVRLQVLCSGTFLQQQGAPAGLVTSVGFSLAGVARYDEFVLRAGVAGTTTLGPDWTVNLPDQRVQVERSGTVIAGGGTPQSPTNEWVDFSLDHPFAYVPGDGLVVDLTTRLAAGSAFLGTTTGAGLVPRAYHFDYTPGAMATSFNQNGIAVRFTFAPLGMVPFGDGCAAGVAQPPALAANGVPFLGTTVVLLAGPATPNGLGVFVLGLDRREHLGSPLPLALGGNCALLVAADFLAPLAVPPSGTAGFALTIPADPSLRGTTVYAQYADHFPNSPAILPFVFSGGGILPLL